MGTIEEPGSETGKSDSQKSSGLQVTVDVLRAEAAHQDLQEDLQERGVRVCAMRRDGTLYGFLSTALVLQDPSAANVAIERIKFAHLKEGEINV